jgi:hypothetical protein
MLVFSKLLNLINLTTKEGSKQRRAMSAVPTRTTTGIAGTSAGFVRQKRGKKVPSFIKKKVASSSAFFVYVTHPAQAFSQYLLSGSTICCAICCVI